MTKKIVFGMLGLLVVVALGFSYKYRQDTDNIISQIPRIEETKIISQMINTGVMDTGSVATGNLSGSDMKSETETDIISNLPLCENKLNQVAVIDMDKVVKNCTEKKKEGRTLDGLGGVFPSYYIYNGEITIEENFNQGGTENTPLCQRISPDNSVIRYYILPPHDTFGTPNIVGYDALKFVLSKGYLSEVTPETYPDGAYCSGSPNDPSKIDQDCADMKESEGWTDGVNYFVAGYRNDIPGKLLYVINNKVYSPYIIHKDGDLNGIGDYDDGYDEHHLGQGVRQFVTIKNNKIIVKRMKDERINMKKKDANDMNTTTYTLQTCEVPL